jgi:CxxC-x17-CxxC domain-containing protein
MNTNQIENIMNETPNDLIFEPKMITCSDCADDFTFSTSEQKFFQEHSFFNQPKRCPNCRVVRRMNRRGKEVTPESKVNCADCNKETVVPFLPKLGKPVYCCACFAKHGGQRRLLVSKVN